MKRRHFFYSFLATAGVSVRSAVPGGLATEWTQILNKVQMLQQYIRQGEELRQKILMVMDMAKHTAQIPAQVFGPLAADITFLHSVVQQGRALAYSMANLDTEFTNRFKNVGYSPRGWTAKYQEWSRTTLDTVHGTMKAANLQGTQMMTEEGILSQLRQMSRTGDGRLKALQVGGQLAEQTIQQLVKLRQLILANVQANSAFQASQMAKEQNSENAAIRLFSPGGTRTDPRTWAGGQ
jgi:type IV secretion system protein TrbJ